MTNVELPDELAKALLVITGQADADAAVLQALSEYVQYRKQLRVLMDTDVWSEFYRRRTGEPSVQVRQLRELIRAQSVTLLGTVRQEVRCGWRYVH